MSVYQVEEYYIFTKVPEDKIEQVKDFINNSESCTSSVQFDDDGDLTIDCFDNEQDAEQCDSELMEIINR